jgi:hypothetical protein
MRIRLAQILPILAASNASVITAAQLADVQIKQLVIRESLASYPD